MGEEALREIPLSAAQSDPKSKSNNDEIETNHQEDEFNEIALVDQSDSSSSSTATDSSSSNSSDDFDKITEQAQPQHDAGEAEHDRVLSPSAHLPQPESPEAFSSRAKSAASSDSFSTIGKFFRDRSSSLSSAINKQISSLAEPEPEPEPDTVTEFNLSGLKVIVKLKEENEDDEDDRYGSIIDNLKGRISFFSRSGCRDCSAVRAFFRQKGLPYVEINVDVFPEREKELIDRAGAAAVPQIFLNEKLVGGLVALNSLRNSGEFEERVAREVGGRRCTDAAPSVPVYGFDDDEEARRRKVDAMLGMVRVLRQKMPIQDRLARMKIVKNCFTGSEMVDAVVLQLDCGRKKAVEIGKELARRHFIHHVFRENDFEDGHNQFYRFLEHDPAIPKCFNFRGATNDDEPKSASFVSHRLMKLMTAILEAYASDDRRHLDYDHIAASEEFRRYVNLVQDLQRVDIFTLSADETMAFFLNLYNAMVIHAVIRVGKPGVIGRRAFFNDFQYIVGGYPYSLSTIRNGILRSNRRQPYSFTKPFNAGDKRLAVALPNVNPLIHFGMCNATGSCPAVRFFTPQGVVMELRDAAREFFLNGGVEVDLSSRTVCLARIIRLYDVDFGPEKDILKWILNYLEATTAGLLTHLLNDGGPINIVYQNFDWSLNS